MDIKQTTTQLHPPRSQRAWLPFLPGFVLLFGGLVLWDGGALLHWGLQHIFPSIGALIAISLLYLLPGLALLRLCWPFAATHHWPAIAYLLLALPLSVALPPVLLLLCNLVGLPWNGLTTWLYLLLALLLVSWPARPNDLGLSWQPAQWRWPWQAISATRLIVDPATIWLLLGGLLILLTRLYVVRDLPTGLLGDSYHHTMMVQLLVDNQGLFQSWAPYALLTSFTYHFGFHANVALVHHISGWPVVTSLLWTGQLLNTILVLALFPFALALGGRPWMGIWTVLLAGFVLSLPGFFVNWGRYTQLTGQIVLLALAIGWLVLSEQLTQNSPPLNRVWLIRWLQHLRPLAPLLLLVILLSVAMMLTHYRVTLLAALLVLTVLVILVLVHRSWAVVATLLASGVFVATLALLLASPWLLNLLSGYLMRNTMAFVRGDVDSAQVALVSSLPPLHPDFLHNGVLLAALVGLLIIGWQRAWRLVVLPIWAILLVVSVVPSVVSLPGTGVIDNLTALGTLYIAAAPLAAYACATVQTALTDVGTRWHAPTGVKLALSGIVLAAVMLLGTPQQATIIHYDETTGYAEKQLVTAADLVAFGWIRQNTAPNAHFLVNSFPAFGGTLVAGTDAGWWLPLLTGRASTLPPLTYGSEHSADPNYANQVNDLAEALRGRSLSDNSPVQVDLTRPEALAALYDADVDYIYRGAHASPPVGQVDWLDTAPLAEHPAFQLVYVQDGVEIFAVQHTQADAE